MVFTNLLQADKILVTGGTIESATIGGLTLKNGNLYSDNFSIVSQTSDGKTSTILKFTNQKGADTTKITDGAVYSPSITCDSLASTGNVAASQLVGDSIIVGDITIEDNTITSGDASITIGQGSTSQAYVLHVSFNTVLSTNGANLITINVKDTSGSTATLIKDCKMAVTYTYGYSGSNSATTYITISAGSSAAAVYVDGGFWGVNSVYFTVNSSTTYSLTQTTGTNNVVKGNLLPSVGDENGYSLGSSTLPWVTVYTQDESGGSDRKIKDNIENLSLELSESLVKNLVPRQFIFKNDKLKRPHYGFIAQEVESEMKSMGLTVFDNALIFKTNLNAPDSDVNFYGLNYRNLIAPLFKVVQNLLERIESLENSSNVLED